MDFISALVPPTTLRGQMNPNFVPFLGLKSMLAFSLGTIRQTKWHNSEKDPLLNFFSVRESVMVALLGEIGSGSAPFSLPKMAFIITCFHL